MVKKPKNPAPQPPDPKSLPINTARYKGSGEHKDQRWWGGLPESPKNAEGERYRIGKQDTTICPLVSKEDQERATEWVKEALLANQVKYRDGNTEFPDQIWYRDMDGQLWMGRCINKTLGHYKGWPIPKDREDEVFG